MLRRHCAILLVAGALWGLPTLCVAGVLKHPCARDDGRCGQGEPCERSHEEPGCSHEGGCGHESDCSSDPCADAVVRSERSTHGAPSPPLQSAVLAAQADAGAFVSSRGLLSGVTQTRHFGRPIPESDIPLLI